VVSILGLQSANSNGANCLFGYSNSLAEPVPSSSDDDQIFR